MWSAEFWPPTTARNALTTDLRGSPSWVIPKTVSGAWTCFRPNRSCCGVTGFAAKFAVSIWRAYFLLVLPALNSCLPGSCLDFCFEGLPSRLRIGYSFTVVQRHSAYPIADFDLGVIDPVTLPEPTYSVIPAVEDRVVLKRGVDRLCASLCVFPRIILQK
jgi:hypothetical protein